MAQQLKASQLKPAYQLALHPRQVILRFSNELRGEAPGQDLLQLFLHFFQPVKRPRKKQASAADRVGYWRYSKQSNSDWVLNVPNVAKAAPEVKISIF